MKQNTTKQPLEEKNYSDSKEGWHTLEIVGYNSIYERKPNGSLGRLIAIADGLDARQSKVNAELIVKAVNERKALLDSLKLMFDCYNSQTILNHQNYEKIKNLVEGMG